MNDPEWPSPGRRAWLCSVPMRRLSIAWLSLVACGSDSKVGHLPDAPPPPEDAASPDAPPAPPPTVMLTVTSNGVPLSRIRVYFQNADNSLVASAMTDDTGTAQAVMTAGGYVTAIDPFPASADAPDELRTFSGVKPGDHLFLTHTDPATIDVPVV